VKTSQSFPFYPSDFILGTMLLTTEEVGAYIRLLCFQWEQGSIPADESKLSRIAGVSPKKLGEVLAKFELGADGYRNARLERVRSEREAYQKRQSDLGKKGGRPKANPTENEKGSESQPFLENKAKPKLPSPSPSPSPSPLKETPLAPETPPASPSSGEGDSEESKPKSGITDGKASGKIPTTTQSKRIAAIFHRRESTPWTDKEIRAYKKIGIVPEDDLAALEAYYAANWPADRDRNILRHDLLTFLNNLPGEIGRAHASTQKKPKTDPRREREIETVHTADTLPRL
jgi:uncharacterized protein YdaU (DUF1376 family)